MVCYPAPCEGRDHKAKPSSELSCIEHNAGTATNAMSKAGLYSVLFCCSLSVLGLDVGTSELTDAHNCPLGRATLLPACLPAWVDQPLSVAFTVIQKSDSLLADCTGGSRDLP